MMRLSILFSLDKYLIKEFVNKEEEAFLVDQLKIKLKIKNRTILRWGVSPYKNNTVSNVIPEYLMDIGKKLVDLKIKDTLIESVTVNIYNTGDYIGPHIDAGPHIKQIVVLSLLNIGDFVLEKENEKIVFEIPPRSLLLLEGEFRSDWKHHTLPAKNKRISFVFR